MELLALTGWPFEVAPTRIDESPRQGERAEDQALRLAEAKARAAADGRPQARLTVAADTLVVHGELVLGKPGDMDEARRMLMALRDDRHKVVTGVALWNSAAQQLILERCETDVQMRAYTDAEVEAYLETGSPLDKAGAYGIQDAWFAPVDLRQFTGCLANVMGLPLCHLSRAARQAGWRPPQDVPAACQSHLEYDCPVFKEILH